MKAVLEFTLPEDAAEYNYARNGALYADALAEFREWLRGQRKHADLGGDELWVRVDAFHRYLRLEEVRQAVAIHVELTPNDGTGSWRDALEARRSLV